MPVPHIAAINLECANPDVLARFWADLLGGEVAVQTPWCCAVKVGDSYLGAAHVDDYQPPTWPERGTSQQIHLDLAVDDLDTAEHRAIGLGATKDSHQPNDGQSRILRDPADHPFCLRLI